MERWRITLVPTAEGWVYLISFTPPKCRDCYDCLYSPFSVVVTMDGVAVTATKLHREPAPPDSDVVSRSVSSVEISSKPSMSAMGCLRQPRRLAPVWLGCSGTRLVCGGTFDEVARINLTVFHFRTLRSQDPHKLVKVRGQALAGALIHTVHKHVVQMW
jgi:hypothetical protein